jgi:hypothetical protein
MIQGNALSLNNKNEKPSAEINNRWLIKKQQLK